MLTAIYRKWYEIPANMRIIDYIYLYVLTGECSTEINFPL